MNLANGFLHKDNLNEKEKIYSDASKEDAAGICPENMLQKTGTQELIFQESGLQQIYINKQNAGVIKWGKLILGAMIIFGLLFPDFIWNYDTVTVTDEEGRNVTDEMSGQNIYEGIYTTDNIEFSFSWLN